MPNIQDIKLTGMKTMTRAMPQLEQHWPKTSVFFRRKLRARGGSTGRAPSLDLNNAPTPPIESHCQWDEETSGWPRENRSLGWPRPVASARPANGLGSPSHQDDVVSWHLNDDRHLWEVRIPVLVHGAFEKHRSQASEAQYCSCVWAKLSRGDRHDYPLEFGFKINHYD